MGLFLVAVSSLISIFLLLNPIFVRGGASGMNYVAVTSVSGDRPDFSTEYCQGPTRDYRDWELQCPESALSNLGMTGFPSRGTINSIVRTSYGTSSALGASCSPPYVPTSNTVCFCAPNNQTSAACVGKTYCKVYVDYDNLCTPTGSNCNIQYYWTYLTGLYTCTAWRRSVVWNVFRSAPGQTVFWSTSKGIYAAPGSGAPNANIAQVVNFPNMSWQDRGVASWSYNNRFYVLLVEYLSQGRVFEIESIPTAGSPVTLSTSLVSSGGHLTNIAGSRFVAGAHAPFSGDSNGIIYTATPSSLSAWRRESSNWDSKGSWSIPQCDGNPCFKFTGSVLLIPVPVGGKTVVAFGATLGRIVLADTSEQTFYNIPETLLAGAGSITSIAFGAVAGRPHLFYGTTLGLLFQFDLVDKRISNLVVIASPDTITLTIHGVSVDTVTGAIFASGGDNNYVSFVARVTVTSNALNLFDYEQLPSLYTNYYAGSGRALLIDSSRNRVYVGADQPISANPIANAWDRDTVIYEYQAAGCNYTCATCGVTDSAFCGYCSGTATCVLNGACPSAELPFSRPPQCPVVTALSRVAGSLAGNSLVTIHGSNLYAASNYASRYDCRFAGVSGTVVSATSGGVTCRTPAGSAVGPVSVELRYNGNAISSASELTFTYVDCASLTCTTCFTDGAQDCVWCMRSGSCAAATTCQGNSSTTACPTLQSVSNSISTSGSTNSFSLQVSNLPAGETYRCNIGGYVTANGTISNSAVTCTRPAGIPAMNVAPFLEVADGPVWRRFTQPRVGEPTLDVYNCTAIGACFPCINQHQDCAFCTSSGCSYDINGVGCSTLTTNCPQISTIVPPRLHYSADGGTALRANIASPGTVDPQTFRCVWTNVSGDGSVITNTAAINATLSVVFCTVPAGNLSRPNVGLEIYSDSTPLTNKFLVEVYDCTYGARCTLCADASRPRCQWCNSLLLCEAPSALPGGTCPGISSGCPTMTVTPNQEPTAGGRTITVIPNPFPAAPGDAECNWVGPDSSAEVIATNNGTAFFCVAPRSPTAQVSQLTLLVDGTEYATPVPFTYFDCTFASAGVPRTCSDCITRSGCGWCGASCAPAASCTTPLSVCPVITNIFPTSVDADSPEFVSIDTNPLPPNDFAYECVFGTERVDATPTPTGLRCQTPQSSFAGATNVRVGVQGNALGFWSTDGTPDQIEFYRCSQNSRQCGSQCFSSSPYCGYCLETGACSGRTACSRAISASDSGFQVDKAWFNETTGCPSISSFGPNYVQASLPNRPRIFERVTFSVSNLQLPAVNATGKRRVGLSDFSCTFGADEAPVTSYNPATNEFACEIPSLADQGFYSVAVSWRGNRINGDNPPRLQVQDCVSIPACGLCLLQPNCGWCRGSVSCMTKAWCDAEPITEFGPQCPTLTRVSPATGNVGGDIQATISGGPFVNSSLLKARFEWSDNTTVVLETTWLDTSTLSIQIPASPNEREGEVKLVVYINETAYTGSELTFTYIAPAGITQGVSTGAIGGIIAAAIAVILVLIGVLIIMRTKKVGFFSQFKLKEPDYSIIAFGSMLQPQWKAPKDNWEILAIKLLAKDHGFVFTVMATTPPTEQDKIARALCHVYEWHKKSVEYGVLFVTDEVSRNLEENTIFRNNSMASKWFKFYSKIIGIKYLFDHLARFIYELNKLSEIKGQEGQDNTGGKSLLSLEMEVDPNKFGNDAFTDSEANVYQLILACQKVFTAFRTSLIAIPPEFIEVFQSMRESIINKFKSEDAVLKAVGGFFFLRFCCPAITAPHAYGLLENPPNESCQRQLVLIGKVIQNLANMTMPGVKEQFMQQLNDFFARNIPKMRQFYHDLLSTRSENDEETQIVAAPDIVRVNGLGFIMEHIHLQTAKIKAHFVQEAADDDERLNALNATLAELLEVYPKKPRKAVDKEEKMQ